MDVADLIAQLWRLVTTATVVPPGSTFVVVAAPAASAPDYWKAPLITAVCALAIALLAQWYAHRRTTARERAKERSDAFDAALEAAHDVTHHLAMLIAAGERRAQGIPATKGVVTAYFGAVERYRSRAVSYVSRVHPDDVGKALLAAMAPLNALEAPGSTRMSDLVADAIEAHRQFTELSRAAVRAYNPSLANEIPEFRSADALAAT